MSRFKITSKIAASENKKTLWVEAIEKAKKRRVEKKFESSLAKTKGIQFCIRHTTALKQTKDVKKR